MDISISKNESSRSSSSDNIDNSIMITMLLVQSFEQYDAASSMGRRRSEIYIWLEYDGGHPW